MEGTKNKYYPVKQSLLYSHDELTISRREHHYLSDICNNDKEKLIKFGIVTSKGKEVNSGTTSIKELEDGVTSV